MKNISALLANRPDLIAVERDITVSTLASNVEGEIEQAFSWPNSELTLEDFSSPSGRTGSGILVTSNETINGRVAIERNLLVPGGFPTTEFRLKPYCFNYVASGSGREAILQNSDLRKNLIRYVFQSSAKQVPLTAEVMDTKDFMHLMFKAESGSCFSGVVLGPNKTFFVKWAEGVNATFYDGYRRQDMRLGAGSPNTENQTVVVAMSSVGLVNTAGSFNGSMFRTHQTAYVVSGTGWMRPCFERLARYTSSFSVMKLSKEYGGMFAFLNVPMVRGLDHFFLCDTTNLLQSNFQPLPFCENRFQEDFKHLDKDMATIRSWLKPAFRDLKSILASL